MNVREWSIILRNLKVHENYTMNNLKIQNQKVISVQHISWFSPYVRKTHLRACCTRGAVEFFVHVSSLIFESIHISPLIATIKKNKIVSLLFNVGLKIFTNSSSSILTPTSLQLCCIINQF